MPDFKKFKLALILKKALEPDRLRLTRMRQPEPIAPGKRRFFKKSAQKTFAPQGPGVIRANAPRSKSFWCRFFQKAACLIA
jgi:hypothetical protein